MSDVAEPSFAPGLPRGATWLAVGGAGVSETFLESSARVIDVYTDILLPLLEADVAEFGLDGHRRWRFSIRTNDAT